MTASTSRGGPLTPLSVPKVRRFIILPILLATIAIASVLSLTASAATSGPGPRIAYRTVHLNDPKRSPEVYSILPSGQGRRLLAHGGEQVAWSLRKKRIAFAGTVGRYGIWVMNADGSHKRALTWNLGDGEPTWSPDGKRIAFRRDNGNSFDLWTVPSAGGTPRPLLRTFQANERSPDWSPDGKRIAYTSTRGGRIQIWILNLSSRVSRRLTTLESFSPDWSPGGRRIAFMSGNRIATINADGSHLKYLPVGTPRSADNPAWSPDGKRIAFQRGGEVLTMRADGSDRRYVTRAAWGTNDGPDW
jgi:Tol biopolymer transport system component